MNITSDPVLQVKASCNAETLELLNDTYRFLFSHHRTISKSAMHTYYSALPFTPHNTRLYHLYKQETSHSITVLQGLSPTWTPCLSDFCLFGSGRSILSISPDGMWLAVGKDRKVMILDAQTTASQCQISLTDYIVCLAFSPSKSTLATVTPESLELWNTTTGINQNTQTLSGTHSYAVAFSSQGQYLLLSSYQGLRLHNGTDVSELSVLSTNWKHNAIIFTSNDTEVITGSIEGYIHFFTLSSNQLSEIQERRIFNETQVYGLVLRHDGKRLASSGVDGTIRIYDLPSRSPIAILRRPESKKPIWPIVYHPTEEELAVGQEHRVVLWRQKESPSDWMPSIHSTHTYPIAGIAYCRNGTQMYTNTEEGIIKLWVTTTTQVEKPPKHAGDGECYAFNQPTSLLAIGSYDQLIILWNLTTGDYLKTLFGHMEWISSLVFSDDGVLLASGSSYHKIRVWDVASGSCLRKLEQYDSYIYVIRFSEDNAYLTTRTNNECFVWELKSGELLERRDRDMSVDEVPSRPYSNPYYLKNSNGWQMVVSAAQRKRCKYVLCQPPGQDYISRTRSPIFGDRAACFCADGRVLILDISRVMRVFMDPAGWLDYDDDFR